MVRRTKSRYHTYLYLSPIKMLVFALIAFSFHGQPIEEYFLMFIEAWNPHEILVKRVKYTNHIHTYILNFIDIRRTNGTMKVRTATILTEGKHHKK